MNKTDNNNILLYKFIDEWKPKLGLYQWRIRSFWEPELEAQGRVYWEFKLKDATILVRPVVFGEPRDPVEKTILHEMIHLIFADFGDPCPRWVEDLVEDMSWKIFKANFEGNLYFK